MNLDLAPTFLDLAGIAIPDDMQGLSLVHLFAEPEKEDWRDAIYYHYYSDQSWHTVKRHEGVRTKTHKLVNYYDIGCWEMFDLEQDPNELDNKYNKEGFGDKQEELETHLQALRSRYNLPENVVH